MADLLLDEKKYFYHKGQAEAWSKWTEGEETPCFNGWDCSSCFAERRCTTPVPGWSGETHLLAKSYLSGKPMRPKNQMPTVTGSVNVAYIRATLEDILGLAGDGDCAKIIDVAASALKRI